MTAKRSWAKLKSYLPQKKQMVEVIVKMFPVLRAGQILLILL
jgi:hypothetical protein